MHSRVVIGNVKISLSPSIMSWTSNIGFLMDWAQMSDLDFGLIRQNISIKKASFHYKGCPLSLKSGNLWLNLYVTSDWFYSQQFWLPYSKNILSVCHFRQNSTNLWILTWNWKQWKFGAKKLQNNLCGCVTYVPGFLATIADRNGIGCLQKKSAKNA